MKKHILSFLCILSLLYSSSCKKDKKNDPSPSIESSWLKAELGTLRSFKAVLEETTIDTIFIQNKNCTQILANDSEGYSLIIVFEGRDTGNYELGSTSKLNSITFANPDFSIWKTNLNGGFLHITKYDTTNKRMSGTFNCNLIHFDPPFDTLKVQNGSFVNLKFTEYE